MVAVARTVGWTEELRNSCDGILDQAIRGDITLEQMQNLLRSACGRKSLRCSIMNPSTISSTTKRRITMRKTIAAIVAALALIIAPTAFSAATWQNNDFKNPSGNIVCSFSPADPQGIIPAPHLSCMVLSSRWVVTLSGQTTDKFRVSRSDISGWRYNSHFDPTLSYGQEWDSHQFTCLSTYQGMRCWTGSLDHGFFISAWSVRTY